MKDVPIKKSNALSFWDYFEDFIIQKGSEKEDMRDYDKSLRKHLIKVEKKLGCSISLELIGNVNSNFKNVWKEYLTYDALNDQGDNGLATNTIGKQNKNLKVFLIWCFDRNIVNRFNLKGFPTVMEEVDKIFYKRG